VFDGHAGAFVVLHQTQFSRHSLYRARSDSATTGGPQIPVHGMVVAVSAFSRCNASRTVLKRAMARILTARQFRAAYQLSDRVARRMCQRGEIPAFKAGARWRVVDVGEHMVQLARRQAAALETTPFLRGVEAAQLMGISDRRLRQLAEAGNVEFKLHGTRRLYALQSLLDYMARSGQNRAQRGGYARPYVMEWARQLVAQKLAEYSFENDLPDSALPAPSANQAQQGYKQT